MFVALDRGSGVRFVLCLLAFLSVQLAASFASAAPGNIQLSWNAPIGCPDREQVLEAIRELMGGSAASGDVSVRVDVARTDSRLVLKLVLKTPTAASERTMESSNCDELARGAALVVALAASPEAPAEARREANAATTPATPVVVAPVSTVAAPARHDAVTDDKKTVAPRRSFTWGPRAAFVFDAGSLPRPTVGGALGVRFDLPFNFSAGAETLLLAPQSASTAAGGGKFWGAALALRPCARLRTSNLYLWPCAVLDLEMMVANGEGVSFTQEGIVWFPRFGAGAEIGYALSRRVGFVTGAWLLYGPSRPTFVVDGTVPVHNPARFAGRVTSGLQLLL